MDQFVETLQLRTRPRSMNDATQGIAAALRRKRVRDGLLTIFIRHTSASLTIQENADPDVRRDLVDALDRLAPESVHYRHDAEGADDMPAHIKTALTSTSLAVPVQDGRMMLGTWQGLYVIEHRARPHDREIALHFMGTFEASHAGGA